MELFGLFRYLLEKRSRDLLRVDVGRELDGPPTCVDQHGDDIEAPWWWVHIAVGHERDSE